MNLRMGSYSFSNVQIPLLWGDRAVVQDKKGRLSIIDLSGEKARIEILADEPAPSVSFRPRVDGIVILQGGTELYSYNPREKSISSITLGLPQVEIGPHRTRVETNEFFGGSIFGFAVGIAVTKDGISLGAPLPPGLAKLTI